MNSFEQDFAKINEILKNIFEAMYVHSKIIYVIAHDDNPHDSETIEDMKRKYIESIHYMEQLTDIYLGLKNHFIDRHNDDFMPFQGL